MANDAEGRNNEKTSLLNYFTVVVFALFTLAYIGNEKLEKSCNSMEIIAHLENFSTCVFSEDDLVRLLGNGCVTVEQPGRGHYSLVHCYYLPKRKILAEGCGYGCRLG